MPTTLAAMLEAGTVIFDGAMGTELYKRNHFVNTCFDELCLTDPAVVRAVHEASKKAGAEVLTTNSFGANRYKLADHLLADRTREIAGASARLAREVAAGQLLVAGSIGPLGRHATGSAFTGAEAVDAFAEVVEALMDNGADFIIFETFGRARELESAVTAARRLGAPYLPCMAFGDIASSLAGESIDDFFSVCFNQGEAGQPLMLGFNCSVGPRQMLEFVSDFVPCSPLPVLAMPNAGAPQLVSDRTFYMTSPEYFASYAKRLVGIGVRAIGGCCGTGPEHIAEAARVLKALDKAGKGQGGKASSESTGEAGSLAVCPDTGAPAEAEASPLASCSAFGAALADGRWLTSVELVPPAGYDLSGIIAKARRCAEAGVDAINIPDGPRASSRVSPMITAARIQAEAGIEAVLHVTCRDRNLIGVQSDLLGCAAAGINNLLIVTGDPPKLGDYPNATAVFDLDSVGLARLARRLNGGLDIGGRAVKPATRFVIGVGADPTKLDQARELERFMMKAEAGAVFAITQPVYDVDALMAYVQKVRGTGVKIIAGIWPLASYGNALFLNNEVPGITIPQAIMERLRQAGDKESARQAGIDIARGILASVRPYIVGVQVSAPFGNVDTALAVLA
ncbi:MAG: bifunctional homocysteine S-methyltransferase/methylenetetrahydrofolate reductase [Spirochaetota bacterium]